MSSNADRMTPDLIEITFNDATPEALRDHPARDPLFDTDTDICSDGSPRCDHQYITHDRYGDYERARCTRAATVRVRVTDHYSTYEAKACRLCADCGAECAGEIDRPLVFEILGDL